MEDIHISQEINENEVKKGNKGKSFDLKYCIKEGDSSEIFLFGYEFVKNNKRKCHLVIDGNYCE